MANKIGRPLREDLVRVIIALNEDDLYTAATIAQVAATTEKNYNSWRKRLARWISYNQNGIFDEKIRINGRTYPAWRGKTLKNILARPEPKRV